MAPPSPAATPGVRTIGLIPLGQLRPATRNAKTHALDLIARAISEHGFVDPPIVDERTQRLVGGHGRLEALVRLRAAGDGLPDGIHVDEDGEWLVPVVRGWSSVDDAEADQVNLALNRLSEVGGWNDRDLAAILEDLNAETPDALDLLGYTEADLEGLLRFAKDGSDDDAAAPTSTGPADPQLSPVVATADDLDALTGDGTTGGDGDEGRKKVRCPECHHRFVPGDR